MEKKKIHMIGNTHIDPVWLWNRAEGMQEVKSSFMSALDRMEEFEDFKFTQSSISYLEWMKENCPRQFARIRERVAEGRWEIVGGMWVEPDCNLPSGESLIRHFLYGKGFVRENFGVDVTTTYNVDSFGHGSNLPAICSGCGIKYYLMSRPDKKHVQVPPVFVWKAKNGSSVIAERTGGEYMAWTRPALEWNLSESLEALEEYGYDRMAVFYGVGNHGGGPTVENIRTIYEMREEYTDLELDFSTMEEFFSKVETDKIQECCREMGRIFYGCYSSDKKIKELNRRAEWTLQKAEIISAMAQTMGRSGYRWPKKELEAAWKETLFHQFHDVLAGTSIEPARDESCQAFEGAIAAAGKIIRNGIQAIANQIDTRGEGFPLILINASGVPFSGVFAANVYVPRAEKKPLRLRDWKSKEIPYCETNNGNSSPDSRKGILFEAEVPAYGYTVYRMVMEGPEREESLAPITAGTDCLDNGILCVHFDPEMGCPDSIRKDGRELLESKSAVRVYYDDRGAWGEMVYEEQLTGEFRVTESRVVESNGMRGSVRFLLAFRNSEMVIDYILEKDSDRLKMDVRLRNAEKHRQITLDIPVAAAEPSVTTETAFLAENKVDCRDENSEHYQHRFADVYDADGSGIGLINDSLYGFRQVGNCYKLILLRNTIFARGKGGPMQETLDEGYTNQGSFRYKLVWIPHERPLEKKRLFSEADLLHLPVEYLGDNCHTGKNFKRTDALLQMNTENVHLSAVKCAQEGGNLIFRLFETEGRPGSADIRCMGREVREELAPYEIRTLRLNSRGFVACDMLEEPLEAVQLPPGGENESGK